MRVRSRLAVAIVIAIGVPVLTASAAFADTAITVSGGTNLLDYDTVTIEGSGFTPNVSIGVCEGIQDADPGTDDCGRDNGLVVSSATGSFSFPLDVRRVITVGFGNGATIDCATVSGGCVVAAAEIDDIAGTVAFAPITFATPPAPPATRGTVTLQGTQPFDEGSSVTATGTGFRANAPLVLAVCNETDPDLLLCVDLQFFDAESDGSFVASFTADVPDSRIPCSPLEPCALFAAERVDVANTIVSAPMVILPARQDNADVLLKRRSDGLILFDNVYRSIVERRSHAIDAGGVWVFAVPIQNDFDTTADLRLVADESHPGFRFRYFLNYAEFTDTVASDEGYVFHDMAPGETRLIAVQFEADADVASGTAALQRLTLSNPAAPSAYDGIDLSVRVR